MPLTDLVRHLNARHALEHPEWGDAYHYDGRSVTACYGGRHLVSRFLAIHGPGGMGGSLFGHRAEVAAGWPGQAPDLDWAGLFEQIQGRREDVYLDRLIRSLHALNYLTFAGQGRLLLPVHRRHLLGVSRNHGLAFEEILRACGLAPQRIVLELDVGGVPLAHLLTAVDNYRLRGYGIALSYRVGLLEAGLVDGLKPDLLHFSADIPLVLRAELQAQVYTWGGRILVQAASHGRVFGPADLVQQAPEPVRPALAA